jgi:hypothetical protein
MHYPPPQLDGNNVPYKGTRYLVIEVDAEHPFEFVTADFAKFAVYDKSMKWVTATVQPRDGGQFWVQMATQCDSGFLANSLKDAAQGAGRQLAYMMEKGWG